MGAQWLSSRVLALRPRDRGFEPHRRHRVLSLSKNINPSLVLVQPRKTRPFITERLLMGRKESNDLSRWKVAYARFENGFACNKMLLLTRAIFILLADLVLETIFNPFYSDGYPHTKFNNTYGTAHCVLKGATGNIFY